MLEEVGLVLQLDEGLRGLGMVRRLRRAGMIQRLGVEREARRVHQRQHLHACILGGRRVGAFDYLLLLVLTASAVAISSGRSSLVLWF